MGYVIKILHRADGASVPEAGQLCEDFDLEFDDGRGKLTATSAAWKAMHFPTQSDALKFWNRQSTVHPIRLWDGKPNRPFTAYTVEVFLI